MPSAQDDDGKPVDWWFLYKLPRGATPPAGAKEPDKPSTGFEYLYYDDSRDKLGLSPHTLLDGTGALHQTLAAIFGNVVGGPDAADVPLSTGWILYNDEIPGASTNDGTRGHTKGVLAFDTKDGSALWLLHSTPRFPHPRDVRFPDDEKIYGQTMLCVTLRGIADVETIAGQMLDEQEPQTYNCSVPEEISPTSPLRELAGLPRVPELPAPSDIAFSSKGGKAFRSIAKSRNWGKDFWNDLVGPSLGVDLDVETWRRGPVPTTADSDNVHKTSDVLSVDLSAIGVPYRWSYTHDHAKWAVSTLANWVCVGDINRMTSQERRGGGTMVVQDDALWSALLSVQSESA
jgi:deoxyribonuclease-2